jgi:hypothetical protein
MLKQPSVRAAVLGVALVTTATAFYFIAPVFVNEVPFSGYPTLAYISTRTPKPTLPPTEMPTATAEAQASTSIVLEGEASLLLLSGEFYDIAHDGAGTASLYLTESDELVLRLEDFQVEDGPELHVYLAVQDPIAETEGEPLAEAIDLGELKGLVGDQTYVLPDDLMLENYNSVVIWCVPYNVPFIGASLETP